VRYEAKNEAMQNRKSSNPIMERRPQGWLYERGDLVSKQRCVWVIQERRGHVYVEWNPYLMENTREAARRSVRDLDPYGLKKYRIRKYVPEEKE
jgi:hypothetical protein